jgi:hypothetical protein
MKSLALAVVAIAWLWTWPGVQGQKATEVFIPIGQSAGLSGKLTRIGKIAAVDTQNRTVTVTDAVGTQTVLLSERTKIYLDLSRQRSPNRPGSIADIRPGLLAEVKFEGNDRSKGVAEWIKVQIGM